MQYWLVVMGVLSGFSFGMFICIFTMLKFSLVRVEVSMQVIVDHSNLSPQLITLTHFFMCVFGVVALHESTTSPSQPRVTSQPRVKSFF